MKRLVTFLIILLAVIGLSACGKKQVKSVQGDLMDGTWKITAFTVNNEDHLHDYIGDAFVFEGDGSLQVSGQHTATGTWNVNKEAEGGLFSKRHLICMINLPIPLNPLSGDWKIDRESGTKIELKDNGDNTDNRLVFEKI